MATAPAQAAWIPQLESGEEVVFRNDIKLLGRIWLVVTVIFMSAGLWFMIGDLFPDWSAGPAQTAGLVGGLFAAYAWHKQNHHTETRSLLIALTNKRLLAWKGEESIEGSWQLSNIRRLTFVKNSSRRCFFLVLQDNSEILLPDVFDAEAFWNALPDALKDQSAQSVSRWLLACASTFAIIQWIATSISTAIGTLLALLIWIEFIYIADPAIVPDFDIMLMIFITVTFVLGSLNTLPWTATASFWLFRNQIPLKVAKRFWGGDLEVDNWVRRDFLRRISRGLSKSYDETVILAPTGKSDAAGFAARSV